MSVFIISSKIVLLNRTINLSMPLTWSHSSASSIILLGIRPCGPLQFHAISLLALLLHIHKACVGKYLSGAFPVQNCLKQGDTVSPFLFSFVSNWEHFIIPQKSFYLESSTVLGSKMFLISEVIMYNFLGSSNGSWNVLQGPL